MARRYRGRTAMARLVFTPCSSAASRLHRIVNGRSRRTGHPVVVAVVQSRTLGRAHRRSTPDCRRADSHQTSSTPIDCRWRDGKFALRPGHPGVRSRAGRVGGCDASLHYRCATCGAVGNDTTRLLSVSAYSYGWFDGGVR